MIFLDGNAHIRYVSVNTCALVMCVVKIRITVRGPYENKNSTVLSSIVKLWQRNLHGFLDSTPPRLRGKKLLKTGNFAV